MFCFYLVKKQRKIAGDKIDNYTLLLCHRDYLLSINTSFRNLRHRLLCDDPTFDFSVLNEKDIACIDKYFGNLFGYGPLLVVSDIQNRDRQCSDLPLRMISEAIFEHANMITDIQIYYDINNLEPIFVNQLTQMIFHHGRKLDYGVEPKMQALSKTSTTEIFNFLLTFSDFINGDDTRLNCDSVSFYYSTVADKLKSREIEA